MANSVDVESEHESEPEESVLLRRRSGASDDDEEVEEEGDRSVRRIGYADVSDGREGAAEYYDDDDSEVSYADELELGEKVGEERQEEVSYGDELDLGEQVEEEREKKVAEANVGDDDAFAVPRTGAFYMHDDRFGGRRCRSRNQHRKNIIWKSQGELKWLHDKFEEMKLEESHKQVHRNSNDYHQGCNKNNGRSGGFKAKDSILHSSAGYGSSVRTVKGRGPVRYKPLSRSISANPRKKSIQLEKIHGTSPKTDSAKVVSANNNQQNKRSSGKTSNGDSERALSTKCKQPLKTSTKTGDTNSSTLFSTKSKQCRDQGMASNSDPASESFHGLNVDLDSIPSEKHLSAPTTSSYLQAFYPASSFHHHNSETHKGMVPPGSRNAVSPALPNQIMHASQANEFLHGKFAQDIFYPKEGVSAVDENCFSKLPFQYSVPESIYTASSESRDQGTISFTHQATPFPNQLNRVSSLAQHIVQQRSVDSTIQPISQDFTQQLHSCLQSGSQRLWEASMLSFREPGIFESLEGSIQLKVASLGTGSNISTPQYTRVLGDQNFSGTPIPFPVMNLGGLHHGTLGDPAIDMTSTGYIDQSQVHIRNPDLTWVPILPAASAAVGATRQPPYAVPDGSSYVNFTTTPIGDIASSAAHAYGTSNDGGTSRPSNDSLPSLETDHVKRTMEQMNNERGGIRPFKPTRYSRMNMKE